MAAATISMVPTVILDHSSPAEVPCPGHTALSGLGGRAVGDEPLRRKRAEGRGSVLPTGTGDTVRRHRPRVTDDAITRDRAHDAARGVGAGGPVTARVGTSPPGAGLFRCVPARG